MGTTTARGDDEVDAVGRFQHDLAGRSGFRRGRIGDGEGELAQDPRQDDFQLVLSVLLADAVARPGAERDESERMPALALFGKEAFRLEGVRIGEDVRIAVHAVEEQAHRNSLRQNVPAYIAGRFG